MPPDRRRCTSRIAPSVASARLGRSRRRREHFGDAVQHRQMALRALQQSEIGRAGARRCSRASTTSRTAAARTACGSPTERRGRLVRQRRSELPRQAARDAGRRSSTVAPTRIVSPGSDRARSDQLLVDERAVDRIQIGDQQRVVHALRSCNGASRPPDRRRGSRSRRCGRSSPTPPSSERIAAIGPEHGQAQRALHGRIILCRRASFAQHVCSELRVALGAAITALAAQQGAPPDWLEPTASRRAGSSTNRDLDALRLGAARGTRRHLRPPPERIRRPRRRRSSGRPSR